ncbi:MAG: ABC transporter permease subunit [Actinobacteria bacterium]|nr:ABC transporter permease subunit [Actinomycetota bacterium]MBU1610160.1 ABC transporter permease subunit [Actinomycetota bacterium]MBU2316009.1 ABC transporter permease subunit [Actinomycetota bacterium]MBU2383925.1 ABC transporter permease subunit [Actinomycetota bacterium]
MNIREYVDKVLVVVGRSITVIAVVALATPIVFTVLLSFANDNTIRFPPGSWGFDRYVDFFTSPVWLSSLLLSAGLALASALIAMAVAIPALVAILRSRLVARAVIEQVSILSLVIPITAYAVAMYSVYAQVGWLGSFWGLAVAHATLALPFVMIVGAIGIRAQEREIELVAITLGASRTRAFAGITLRLALPAFVGAFFLAFQASFEEAVLVNFLGGSGLLTLPKRILDSIQWGSEPMITAIASTVVVATTIATAVTLALLQRTRRLPK